MTEPDDGPSPMAVAFEWVGRILAVVVVMVGPGLLGTWLDERLGTSFLTLVGFASGLALGIYYLILMTRPRKDK